jgi:hypothetical protein
MAIYIRRRELIATLGGAVAAWPLAARAQQHDRMRRVGILSALPESDPEEQRRVAAFIQGLRELGWRAATFRLIIAGPVPMSSVFTTLQWNSLT